MKKLIGAIIVISCVFYFIQPPTVTRDEAPKVYTSVEKEIVQEESGLSLEQRVDRVVNFKESVQEAVSKRVSKANYVPGDEISPLLKEAVVAVEDKRFYEHPGIDFYGIVRAFYMNSLAGETVEGGSTITQQLVKNLFLSSKREWTRKVEEVALAGMMEHYYTKDEILTMYLNSIYFGDQYYGVKKASRGYFNETPAELNLAQAALLAGIPQAPVFYNPKENPIAAIAKREIVLEAMLKQQMITKKQLVEANAAPLLKSVAKPVAKVEASKDAKNADKKEENLQKAS